MADASRGRDARWEALEACIRASLGLDVPVDLWAWLSRGRSLRQSCGLARRGRGRGARRLARHPLEFLQLGLRDLTVHLAALAYGRNSRQAGQHTTMEPPAARRCK